MTGKDNEGRDLENVRVRRTQVAHNLLDHVLEHASAVLRVKERQELLLVQQLVCWGVVSLKPAVLQALHDLLSCIDEDTKKSNPAAAHRLGLSLKIMTYFR